MVTKMIVRIITSTTPTIPPIIALTLMACLAIVCVSLLPSIREVIVVIGSNSSSVVDPRAVGGSVSLFLAVCCGGGVGRVAAIY